MVSSRRAFRTKSPYRKAIIWQIAPLRKEVYSRRAEAITYECVPNIEETLCQIICKVTALNQPRSRQLVLDVGVVDRSRDEAGDPKGGLQDDHGKQ